MVKVFITIGLLLIILAVPGLYWFSFQNDQLQQRIAFCKSKYSCQVDEYIHNLTGSSSNSADINDFDSAAALNMERMTPSQRQGYQHERLLVDIDELAQSTKPAPENANLLYGSGWQQKVLDYKNKKQLLAAVQVASVTAAIAGGVLFSAAFVFLIVRIFVGFTRWLIRLFSGKRAEKPVSSQPKPSKQEKSAPPAATVSNTQAQTQTARNPNPTAEEFRKLLIAQTESLKETVDQLKNLAGVLQQRATEHDQVVSKKLEMSFKSQTESFKSESDQLRKLTDDIRTAVDQKSKDLAKAIEDSSISHTSTVKNEFDKSLDAIAAMQKTILGLNSDKFENITHQIDKLLNDIHASTESKTSDIAAVCEKTAQAINLQIQAFKKEISPLSQITAVLADKLEKISSRSAENSETAQQYVGILGEIKQQLAKLADAVEASASENSGSTGLHEKIEQLIDTQSQSLTAQIEPLKEITDSINRRIAEIGKTRSLENTDISSRYADGLSEIKQQISELANALQESALRDSEPVDISDKLEKLLREYEQNVSNEIESVRHLTDMLAQKLTSAKAAEIVDGQPWQETQIARQISEEFLIKGDAISKNIVDLTEQVGAIREYAARQQQHLAKLQDGYDWNLIKNFCMRVIRCIDNLDDRIAELTENGDNPGHLLTVRDELAFILESNGVEPFGAKIDSDYRGQENRLQVLNERDEAEDSNLVGKISQVVRPGYQCRVNDEYTKIVRPAHVRLYGSNAFSNVAVRGD